MPVSVKNLYAGFPATSAGTTIATGASQGTRITKLLLHNTDATTAQEITLRIGSTQFYKKKLEPNETVDWSDPTNLNNTQVLTGINTTASKVSIIASGHEFT